MAKAAELSQTLRSRGPTAVESTPEACERMVLAAQRELAIAALDRHCRLLCEVRVTLSRIEAGACGLAGSARVHVKLRRLHGAA